jgi:hypothetical protein
MVHWQKFVSNQALMRGVFSINLTTGNYPITLRVQIIKNTE